MTLKIIESSRIPAFGVKELQRRHESNRDQACPDEALLTVSISPRHFAHTMDKRTRANVNCDLACTA